MLRVDLGCGPNKKEGFIGADIRPFDGKVDVVLNLGTDKWPWEDNTVTEVWCSHFLEHLVPAERIHLMNELFRVLMPGAQATFVTPHWCSTRAYGDLDHKWPPVAEMFYIYLNKEWRDINAPHDDFYTCDFQVVSVWPSMRPDLLVRNDEYRMFALGNFKEAAQDLCATIKKP